MTDVELDQVAAEIYDFCCAARSKDGNKPREVGREFDTLFEETKEFYRNMARWHDEKTATWGIS